MIYQVCIEKGDDAGFIAHCPSHPGCRSQGETLEETVENIKDAICGCIEALGQELISPPQAVWHALHTTHHYDPTV
jgi:predicted RNase H-like HicB family nuclease